MTNPGLPHIIIGIILVIFSLVYVNSRFPAISIYDQNVKSMADLTGGGFGITGIPPEFAVYLFIFLVVFLTGTTMIFKGKF